MFLVTNTLSTACSRSVRTNFIRECNHQLSCQFGLYRTNESWFFFFFFAAQFFRILGCGVIHTGPIFKSLQLDP